MPAEPRSYAFGPFVLDTGRGILLKHGVRVALTPRAIDLLSVLVTHAGEVLGKDDLIRLVWGRTSVEENNLARQISSLRRALGETPGTRDYIATVPGVGYRFVAHVAVVSDPIDTSSSRASGSPQMDRGSPDRPDLQGWFRQPAVLAVGTALAATIVAAAAIAWHGASRVDAGAATRSMLQVTFGGLHETPAWSPDGRRLAFAADRLGSMDIWVQALGDAEPTRITTSAAREWQPAWSPDGRQLVYRSEDAGGGLYVVAATGGEPRRLADFGDHPQWSPAGDRILFSNATVRTGTRKLYVVHARGGVPQEVGADVIGPFVSGGWLNAVDAAWHPDGTRISIWGRTSASWAMVTFPVAGGPPVRSAIPREAVHAIEEARVRLGRFAWAPSGRMLYFEGQTGDIRNIWRVRVNPATLGWTGAPERLTTDAADESDIALSPDGSRLAFTVRSQRSRVWALDFDPKRGRLTGGERALTDGSNGQIDVDTLPDGSRLAYRALRGGRSELRQLTPSNREDRVLLASADWSPSMPRWSSDGSRLAYARPVSSGSASVRNVIAILSPDERREQWLTLPGEMTVRPSDWSLDGGTILGDCRSARGDVSAICTVPAPSSAANPTPQVRVLVRDAARHLFGPRFSPDQRWVSFVAIDAAGSTTSQVYVAPSGGGAWIPITDGRSFVDKARWSPDGRTLFFVSNWNGYLNLYGRPFDPATGDVAGGIFPVTSFDSPRRGLPSNIAQVEFAVSQRRLFLPITETQADIWVLDQVDR